MEIRGDPWRSVGIRGDSWGFFGIFEDFDVEDFLGFLRIFKDFLGFFGISWDFKAKQVEIYFVIIPTELRSE